MTPSWRLDLLAAGIPSADPVVVRVRAQPNHADVVASLELLQHDQRRGCVEGYLLADDAPEAIAERFSVPVSVIELYQALAFDIASFSPVDRALLAHDPDVSPIVRRLRALGLRGAWQLDHALGLHELTDAQKRELEDQLVSRLLANGAGSHDLAEISAIASVLAKLRGATPEPQGPKGELDILIERLRERLEPGKVPQGIPDLEANLARPQKKADRDHTANTAP